MGKVDYTLEMMNEDKQWVIVARDPSNGKMQQRMHEAAAEKHEGWYRVIENPSRRIVIMHTPGPKVAPALV